MAVKRDRTEYNKQYYAKNKKRLQKNGRAYYSDNREKNLELKRGYYLKNKNKIYKYVRKWIKENIEHCRKWRKVWYQKNREKELEKHRKWQKTEKGKAANQRGRSKRRAREENIINTLTAQEWIDILKEYKFRCAYCGKEFTLFDRETHDHIIPVSKGGHNVKKNVVPACKSCNSKKGNKILTLKG